MISLMLALYWGWVPFVQFDAEFDQDVCDQAWRCEVGSGLA